ncbi:FAD-dependent oxidoreductase [Bacillota bacterium]
MTNSIKGGAAKGSGQRDSLWTSTCKTGGRSSLPEDYSEREAVVIGGGMAGILTAHMLKEKGLDTVILESDRIGSGTTGYTTAKITAQHNLIYDRLISSEGIEKARQYARANMQALSNYRKIISERNIDCSFEEKPAYLYTLEKEGAEELKKEAEAAIKLGIHGEFLEASDLNREKGWGLPFTAEAALRFSGQAQFHPLKFLKAIAQDLNIFESTRVTDVQLAGSASAPQDSERSVVITEKGQISARYVIFTCRFPFLIMPGYYFARMYQDRSYFLGLRGCPDVNGLYLGIDKPAWSFRNHEDILLFGGLSHRSGENEEGGYFKALRDQAARWYPGAEELYAWSTQDCMPLDGVPYMGVYAQDRPNWYVASGFQKWGMSSSMVAADIISSAIAGKPFEVATEGADVFSPHRFTVPVSAKKLWDDVKTISVGLVSEVFSMPNGEAASVEPGHGGVVEYKGEKTGIYRDESGKVFAVATRCSHMGCQLAWNPDELSWDCPCHGSRFNILGEVISGPAIKSPGALGGAD